MNEILEPEVEEQQPVNELHDINDLASPTLARLIEEVRNEEAHNAHAYNRMHNRHNRSR